MQCSHRITHPSADIAAVIIQESEPSLSLRHALPCIPVLQMDVPLNTDSTHADHSGYMDVDPSDLCEDV